MITALWVENEGGGGHVGAHFLLFESLVTSWAFTATHTRWAQSARGHVGRRRASEAHPTVYTRSPSSRAKEMFSE